MESAQAFSIAIIIATNLITIVTLNILLENKTDNTIRAIREEMKDFHDRLCQIEERNKK